MKELEYPFDSVYILSKKKQIKKELLNQNKQFLDIRVAILGGSTTHDIKLVLELFLLNYGIKPLFYESEYNQYYSEIMFENEALQDFKPDIIYIYTTNRNILTYPKISDTPEKINEMLENEMEKFTGMWDRLAIVYGCPVIQNNFEYPFYRLMGNKDVSDVHGAVNYINRLNMRFYDYAQTHKNFYICDINYLSADYGLKEWSDPFYWYMYKYALSVPAIPYLSFEVAKIIKSIFGKNKKGFVLDLDNTLWGGVIGDDGVDNIAIGPEEPKGQAYSDFQRYIKANKQLGVVLNIASKNNYENAISGLNHPNNELKPDDFIEMKVNWDSKDKNVSDIAQTLNLLPESLVFVDDNPAERAIVSEQLGVIAPEIKNVEHYISVIDHSGFFEVTDLSNDDLKRNEMYKENAQRIKLQAKYSDYNDYLKSLEMKAVIKPFESVYMARIAQLTNKSNQFNLTTKRYTQDEIEKVANSDQYITLYGKLEDRFGDNGIVALIIAHKIKDICDIDLWVMSCRVLKRNMEYAMFDKFIDYCKKNGIKRIRGYYYPTAKNDMVHDFYGVLGFQKVEEDEEGNIKWEFYIPDKYEHKNKVIKVEDEQ